MLHRLSFVTRAVLLGATVTLAACNWVLGLPEGIQADGGGGSGASAPGGGGNGAGPTEAGGGGGGNGAGGNGGGGNGGGGNDSGGGGSCPPEETQPEGVLFTQNGSFEMVDTDWSVTGGVSEPSVVAGGFCGCSYAEVTLDGSYGELRYIDTRTLPLGTTLRLRARIKAPDSVDVFAEMRGDNVALTPHETFGDDSLDEEGADGWRLAERMWVADSDLPDPHLAIAFDGSAGQVVGVDCVRLTYELPP